MCKRVLYYYLCILNVQMCGTCFFRALPSLNSPKRRAHFTKNFYVSPPFFPNSKTRIKKRTPKQMCKRVWTSWNNFGTNSESWLKWYSALFVTSSQDVLVYVRSFGDQFDGDNLPRMWNKSKADKLCVRNSRPRFPTKIVILVSAQSPDDEYDGDNLPRMWNK